MTGPTVSVISSCYGGIDEIAVPPEQTYPVAEWVMVTDGCVGVPAPWRHVEQERAWAHPRFAAKHAKSLPFDYVNTDIAIWLDSGARILSADFVKMCVDTMQYDAFLVACWPHPHRSTIAEEALVSAGIPKYAGMDLVSQVEHYKSRGYTDDCLYATGCLVWRWAPDAGRHWLAEQLRWGVQDQISFPYSLWHSAMRPALLPGALYGNGLVAWTAH